MVRLVRSSGFRVVWVAVAACCLGARPQCDVATPGPPCDGRIPLIFVEPGTCTDVPDPCHNNWAGLATLSFTHAPAGLWFEVHRRPTGTTVSICAADSVAVIAVSTFTVRIVEDSGEMSDVDLAYSTGGVLYPLVTAEPETINVLDTVRLAARGRGGVPPYTYHWSFNCTQGEFITDPDQDTVLVHNCTCDTYFLTVTDASTHIANMYIGVPTYVDLSMTATPAVIDSGGASFLATTVIGEEMLGTHWWESTEGIDTPARFSTYAHPETTTTYTLYVKTNLGMVSSASATVTVRE
jgi:hypothetical protein